MARSDLLVSLVKAGTVGDRRGFRSAAEAISADELILPPVVRRAVDELVEEQQGADVLRANGLES
jgi:hypothetical protein